MASITLKNIAKKYPNNLVAVSDFTLEIKDREVIVLVGPSGCGKSTTLRMIAGLEEISEGELYIGGRLVNEVKPKDRGIAMVFQNYAIFPHMTVFENIAFGLKPAEMPAGEIKAKVEEVAGILDITHLLARMPRELSGGQKQRVALGRAFVRDNKVVLLDEPLSNLDAKLRLYMRTELLKLHQKFETTFIYVTHDQGEAMEIADRIVVMNKGVIQHVGTPEELYAHPCNAFVAAFLGTPQMNFWNAKISEDGGSIYVNFGEVKIKLPEAKTGKVKGYIGREVVAGVRPKDIYEDGASIKKFGGPVIDADVKIRSFRGDEVNLLAVSEAMGAWEYNIRTSPDCAARSGDKIKIAINPEKIYLFDKDTETAIVN